MISEQQRHGRGSDDSRRELPTFVRFVDIQTAGIAGSWTQLLRMIDCEAPGVLLSSNIRGWPIHEIETWLAGRPTGRKTMPEGCVPGGRRRTVEHDDTTTTV